MATTCGDLFVSCDNSVVDNRHRRQKKVVNNQSEHVEEWFVQCTDVVQNDSNADRKLTGVGGGSITMTRIQGGNYTFVQKDTKTEIENNGRRNTETIGLNVESATVEQQSDKAELYIHGQFAPGSKVYGIKATNGAHIKGPAESSVIIVSRN